MILDTFQKKQKIEKDNDSDDEEVKNDISKKKKIHETFDVELLKDTYVIDFESESKALQGYSIS